MFKKTLKNSMKNHPPLWDFYKFLFEKFSIIMRLKDVVIMMILFNLYPAYTYKFSTRKLLPSKDHRLPRPKKIEPYKILKEKSKMKKMGNVNLVTIGSSFNMNNLKKLKGEIFFSPGWEPLKKDKKGNIFFFRPGWDYNDKKSKPVFNSTKNSKFKKNFKNQLTDYKRKNITYCASRQEILDKYLKKKYKFLSVSTYHKVGKKIKSNGEYWESREFKNLFKNKNLKRIAVLENFYKPNNSTNIPKWAPTGSILPCLYALSKFSKQVNVYGWDFYLETSPLKMSYWKIFFNLYKYEIDVLRSKNHFESALLNFYYAYQLSKLPNINIYGHLGNIGKHKKLIKKIERVLFN